MATKYVSQPQRIANENTVAFYIKLAIITALL